EAIVDLDARLAARGVTARRLETSHAFHSAIMDPVLDAFRVEVERVNRRAPRIPFISNVTGTWITADEATDASYWTRHLRQPVRSRRIRLPTYPFERQRFWIDTRAAESGEAAPARKLVKNSDTDAWFYAPVWTRRALAPADAHPAAGPWLVFVDDAGVGDALV